MNGLYSGEVSVPSDIYQLSVGDRRLLRGIGLRVIASILWIVGLAFLNPYEKVSAQETRYVKVPFAVDMDTVTSSLVLEVSSSELQEPFINFAGRFRDSQEEAFYLLLDKIRLGDTQSVSGYFQRPPFTPDETGTELAKGFVEAFQSTAGNASILRRYNIGDEAWFAFQIVLEGQPLRRILRIDNVEAVNLRNFWKYNPAPQKEMALVNVLANAEQKDLEEGGIFVSADDVRDLQYRRQLTNENSWWRFNGQPAYFDIFNAQAQLPDHPVLLFYHQFGQSMATGLLEAVLGFFTEDSRANYEEWAVEMGLEKYQSFVRESVQAGRMVRFLIDADPIYLVFFDTADGRTEYDTIYKSQDGSFRVTNFYREYLIDDILMDQEYFVDSVIRPLFVPQVPSGSKLANAAAVSQPGNQTTELAGSPAEPAVTNSAPTSVSSPADRSDAIKDFFSGRTKTPDSGTSSGIPVLGILMAAFGFIVASIIALWILKQKYK